MFWANTAGNIPRYEGNCYCSFSFVNELFEFQQRLHVRYKKEIMKRFVHINTYNGLSQKMSFSLYLSSIGLLCLSIFRVKRDFFLIVPYANMWLWQISEHF